MTDQETVFKQKASLFCLSLSQLSFLHEKCQQILALEI